MDKKNLELKRCPFCGCDMGFLTIRELDGRRHWEPGGYHDEDCIMRNVQWKKVYPTAEALANAWNKRAVGLG